METELKFRFSKQQDPKICLFGSCTSYDCRDFNDVYVYMTEAEAYAHWREILISSIAQSMESDDFSKSVAQYEASLAPLSDADLEDLFEVHDEVRCDYGCWQLT